MPIARDEKKPRSIAVVGGGTAGLIAALTLRRWHPDLGVTLIESSKIPVIGVGESTTSEIIPFLHVILGIDIYELYREVQPTWKLGIRFLWGKPDGYFFNYPFDRGGILESLTYDGHIRNCTALSFLMTDNKTPLFASSGAAPLSGLPYLPFGYHLDNRRFVSYLHRLASAQNIHFLDRQVTNARPTPAGTGIRALQTSDGEQLTYDFYIDCTGFRSLLLGEALGSPFLSYGTSLWTDSAVIANAAHGGRLKPYTTAETMDGGWCWTIPQRQEDHLGYVFASSYLTADQAAAEMRRVHPGIGECSLVRFRSGRHRECCIGNVAALGNSFGFVEPLESTAIFALCRSSILLASQLQAVYADVVARDSLNRSVASLWDYIRWFLSVHYRFNDRLSSPFWRDCRQAVDVSGAEAILQQYRTEGPLTSHAPSSAGMGCGSVFDAFGYDVLLMGQQVSGKLRSPAETEPQYRERIGHYSTLARTALPQAEALRLIQAEPGFIEKMLDVDGWVAESAKYLEDLR